MELRTDRFKFKDLFPDKAKKYAQKLHIKADEIEFVRKGIPIDPKDIEVKEGERAAIRYVTTPHLDRDSEILIPTGAVLDDFRQSPSVLYGHDYRSLPIGKDLWIKPTTRGILAKTQYAKHQFAEDVYQCVRGKFLNSNSVGFIPVESVNQDDKKAFADWQDTLEKEFEIPKDESGKAKNIYTKWIMLEHSDVPVASNAQSLNVAVSKGDLPIQSERLKKDLGIVIIKDIKKKEDLEIEIVKDDEKSNTEAKKEFAEAVGYLGELDNLKYEVSKDELGRKVEKMSIEGKPSGDRHYSKIEDLGWVRIIKGKELFKDEEIITKPETPGKYHRIPVESPDKHKGHRIRTIVISASKGIKALYCGQCKKVITYLFDVNKWSMQEAQAWVSEHKSLEAETVGDITDELNQEEKEVFLEEKHESDDFADVKETVNIIREQFEKILEEKDEHITDLKEGRVLSRKNRKIVKDAITALNAVLKADSAGTQEDEESEGGGNVTERDIEVMKDGEKEFSKEDIVKLVKEVSGEQMGEILEDAFKKALDPEKIKDMVSEGIRIEVKKLQGKVE